MHSGAYKRPAMSIYFHYCECKHMLMKCTIGFMAYTYLKQLLTKAIQIPASNAIISNVQQMKIYFMMIRLNYLSSGECLT